MEAKIQLPIHEVEKLFCQELQRHQVVVVVGETGTGKTTQLPVFMYKMGLASNGIIGVTEPRRIAAVSVAKYVAEQIGSRTGDTVGYKIRFEDLTGPDTDIQFMTDGILLREFQIDPDLNKYSVIMVDEAHERSENIDFVLGLLKDLLKRRRNLKVVIASATIDEGLFSRYFSAPVIRVPGRMYPVEVFWAENLALGPLWIKDIAKQAAKLVKGIHQQEGPGDILVFMPGESEIQSTIKELRDIEGLITLPVYAALSPEEQQRIFRQYPDQRKVVVATNIAETSITIEGIVYVIDSGLIKQMFYDPESGIQSLETIPHSQAGCQQRAGRAGRTRTGKCLRLYSKDDFGSRPEFTQPEIQRVSLASVVLTMKSIGIEEIENFEFIEPPDKSALHEAVETLIALDAIERGKKGLTETGQAMARLPLEPRIAKMILVAQRYGCTQEVATIAAFLSARHIFQRPKDKEFEADAAHRNFQNKKSDALTFLNVWDEYEKSGFSSAWCYENFLNAKALAEIAKIREQLLQILRIEGITISSSLEKDQNLVRKAVAAGLVFNLLEHRSRFGYEAVLRNNGNNDMLSWNQIFIHPGSGLFGSFGLPPRFIVAAEIVATTKTYARVVTEVEPSWLPDIAPSIASFGPPRVCSYKPESQTAQVEMSVFFMGRPIETITKEVTLAEAQAIQEADIAKARQEGLIRLTFWEGGGGVSAKREGKVYVPHFSHTVKPNCTYYCRVESVMAGTSAPIYAQPVFEIFDLGSGANDGPAPQPLATQEVEAAVTKLQELWKNR